jgi:hypothetical protein
VPDDRAEKPHDNPGAGRTGREIHHERPPSHPGPAAKKQTERTPGCLEVHALFNAWKRPIQQTGGHLGGEIRAFMTAAADREHHIDPIAIAPPANRPGGKGLVIPGA